jgi:hypothetical protein
VPEYAMRIIKHYISIYILLNRALGVVNYHMHNSDEEDEYVHAQIDDDNEQINEDEDLDNYYTELEQEVDDIMQYIFND